MLAVLTCSGQSNEVLNPKHIESPHYPRLAFMARISGTVILALTIDDEGNVKSAETTADKSGDTGHPLLQASAIENAKKWIFSKPSHAPFLQRIIYVYEIDPTMPRTYDSVERIYFDLPDRVRIVSNNPRPDQD
jgi:TonB family protein